MHRQAKALMAVTAFAGLLAGEPTLAQVVAPAGLEEIIVTARRREENLQSVPIAITAVSQEQIDSRRIQTANDLQRFVPSLRVNNIALRNDDGEVRLRALTGVLSYFAEARGAVTGPGRYFDLENLQVLKGPQGTLFGGSSNGGAILASPRRPSDSAEGYLRLGVGNHSDRQVEGALNVPLIAGKLLLRVAATREVRDGYITDVGPYFAGKDYENVNHAAWRVGLTFQPSEIFDNYLVYSGYHKKVNGLGVKAIDYNPVGTPFFVFGQALVAAVRQQQAIGPHATALSTDQLDRSALMRINDIAQLRLGDDLTLRNIFSFSREKALQVREFEGTYLPIIDQVRLSPWGTSTDTLTEEPQLQGRAFAGRLTYTVGAYFERSKPARIFTSGSRIYGAPTSFSAGYSHSRSRAGYGQATYDLGGLSESLDGLRLTAGYRRTSDRGTTVINSWNAAGACTSGGSATGKSTPNCAVSGSVSSQADTYTFGIDYQVTSDTLLYATRRRGYTPGVANLLAPTPELTRTRPEFVEDYEIGAKKDWDLGAGARARTNIDYYSISYKDIIVSTGFYDAARNVAGQISQNAAGAKIEGVEFEGQLVPVEGLELGAVYAWSTANYTTLRSASAAGVVNLSGYAFPGNPRHKFTLSGTWHLPIPDRLGDLSLSVNYARQGQFWASCPDPQPYCRRDAYGLVDLRADWKDVGGYPIDVGVYVKNVANKVYLAAGGGVWTALGYVPVQYSEPRFYGASLRYRFEAS